ncbi:MAG: hypothetical protein J6P98_07310 [Clostridia bacterium]|nr:hypothetical protein [Clostridia bacterium]
MAHPKRRLVVKDRKKMMQSAAKLIGILLAAAGAVVLIVLFLLSRKTRFVLNNSPIEAAGSVCGTGDGILYLDGSMLGFCSFRDEDENYRKSISGSVTASGVSGAEGVKVVYADNALEIVGSDFDVVPEGRVIAVRCGRTHAAVLTESVNGSRAVTVYTSAAQKIQSFEFAPGRLMDFGFSEASRSTLWTMELTTESGSPKTTISTFDLDRMSSTGVITVTGQLVEKVFFTNSSVFVAGTESLIRYSASANREVYRVQLYGYRVDDISLSGNQPVLLLVRRGMGEAEECDSVRLITVSEKDVASEKAVTVVLPKDTVGCHLVNGTVTAVTANSVIHYKEDGERDIVRELPLGVTENSYKLDEHHILLERSGEFVLLTVGK